MQPPPPTLLLLLLLTRARLPQAKQIAHVVTCSEQQEVTLQCPLGARSGPGSGHRVAVLWFIGNGANGTCGHPDYVERFMDGGHHHEQALYDIRHHHFIPDNHRTVLRLSQDAASLVLSVRSLRTSDSGVYCCVRRLHRARQQGPPPPEGPRGASGTRAPHRRGDQNATAAKEEGAHRYSVLSVMELRVTQAQGDGAQMSPACHGDGKADARDVAIVILVAVVGVGVIVIVVSCYRAQRRRGRVFEREMSNIYSPTSPQVMSPDPETPAFDFEYQSGFQGGVFPRPGPLQSTQDDEVFMDDRGPVISASTLQLISA